MTTTQVVETPVTNNSLSKDCPHPDDHAKQITDTLGSFKPFTKDVIILVTNGGRTGVDLRGRSE